MMRQLTSQSSAAPSRRTRFARRLVPALLLAGILAAPEGSPRLDASPAPASGSASLIYAGWFGNTIPTPSFVQANLAFLESQPFDGLVVYLRDPGLTANVTTTVMTNTPVSYQTAMWVMSPVMGLPFTNLTQNLGLIQGSTPPDFFDDWSVPIQNFANVAKAAKDSGLKGLCFDNEQYFAPWGDYGGQTKYAATKSLAEYQAQARLRGQQVMEAMVAQFPDIAVITLHGPYVSEPDAPVSLEFPQWQSGNELLGPFFAGFMEGAGDTACNMDGGELYTLRTAAQFEAAYTWCKNDLPSDAVDCAFIPPELRTVWPARSSISYGVYDCPFGGAGMDPTILRSTLANALRQADRYVWFYAEASTYLLPAASGGAADAWVNAVRQARIDAGTGTTVPTAPANLAGQAVSTTEIAVTWEDRSSNETGVEVHRKTGPDGAWSHISTSAADATAFNDPGRTPGTGYVYRVRAVNAAGASAFSNESSVSTTAAPQIPSAPSNLAATAVTSTSVTLAWTDGSTNENGFSIERNIGGSWTQVGWVPDNVTTYTNAGLSPGTSYSYRVLAFNGAGNSATTNQISVTTLQVIQIPGAPSNLRTTAVTTASVTLAWTDGSTNENGFSIERNIGGSWTQIGWVPDNVTAFFNSGLSPNTSYSYRVLAFNGAGNSPPSNQVTVTTQSAQVPAAPSNLRVTGVTSTSVTLAWTDCSSNENGFSIERRIGGSWVQIGWVADNVTTFRHSGLNPNRNYTYRVKAFNAAGNSGPSNKVSAATPAP